MIYTSVQMSKKISQHSSKCSFVSYRVISYYGDGLNDNLQLELRITKETKWNNIDVRYNYLFCQVTFFGARKMFTHNPKTKTECFLSPLTAFWALST